MRLMTWRALSISPWLEDISYMLSQNLFRGLPPSNHEITGSAAGDNFDPEEEEPTLVGTDG